MYKRDGIIKHHLVQIFWTRKYRKKHLFPDYYIVMEDNALRRGFTIIEAVFRSA